MNQNLGARLQVRREGQNATKVLFCRGAAAALLDSDVVIIRQVQPRLDPQSLAKLNLNPSPLKPLRVPNRNDMGERSLE